MIYIGRPLINVIPMDDQDNQDNDDSTNMPSYPARYALALALALPPLEEDTVDNNNNNNNNSAENVLPFHLKNHPSIYKLSRNSQNFLITDPHQAGNPIVYASPGFLLLVGYPVSRVLGRNCRFMQGPDTDPSAIAKMRAGVESGQDEVSVCLLNYRLDGTTFWNQVIINPIHNSEGVITHYVGVQYEVSDSHSLIQQDGDDGDDDDDNEDDDDIDNDDYS